MAWSWRATAFIGVAGSPSGHEKRLDVRAGRDFQFLPLHVEDRLLDGRGDAVGFDGLNPVVLGAAKPEEKSGLLVC